MKQIYISRNSEVFGPYSEEEARMYLKSGQLTSDDLASVNREDWKSLATVLKIAPPPPPPPMAKTAEPPKSKSSGILLLLGFCAGLLMSCGLFVNDYEGFAGVVLVISVVVGIAGLVQNQVAHTRK